MAEPDSASQNPIHANRAVSVVAVAIFLFSMWQFLPTIDDREFHRDEARWIHRAEYVRELANPFSNYWDESTWADGESLDHRNRLRAQPPVGSYVMGIGFLLQGQSLPNIGYWNMDHDTPWNAEQGNMPTDTMLTTARRTTATLTALTAVAIFLIGTRISTITGAALGAVFFSLHPLARYLSTFAGSDAALVFFIAMSALCAARLAEKPSWPRAILLGFMIGLGGGVKLSPLGIAFALAAVGLLLIVRKQPVRRPLGIMLTSMPVVAGITFVVSYPYLWQNPIENSLNVLRYRSMSFDLQGSMWEQVAVETRWEAVERIWNRFGSVEWSVLGRFADVGWPLENVLALAGMAVLVRLVIRAGLASSAAMIAATIGSAVLITVMGLQVDWARYHFVILLAMALCIGTLIGGIESAIRKLVHV